MKRVRVPDVVIRRLVIYLRILSEMELGTGPNYISSQELGDRAGVSPAQVRKDLASFGEFGKQGVGYESHYLRDELRSILNLDRRVNVAVFGFGELGTALTRYVARRAARDDRYPFRIAAVFDSDPTKVGQEAEAEVLVSAPESLVELAKSKAIDIVIIAVPATAAQGVADRCVQGGVKALLNFAPAKLFVPPGVRVHYSDVSLELQQLSYYLS